MNVSHIIKDFPNNRHTRRMATNSNTHTKSPKTIARLLKEWDPKYEWIQLKDHPNVWKQTDRSKQLDNRNDSNSVSNTENRYDKESRDIRTVLIDPHPKFIDTASRFNSSTLPPGEFGSFKDFTPVYQFKENYDPYLHHISVARGIERCNDIKIDKIDCLSFELTSLLSKIVTMLWSFYQHNVFIYPKTNDIFYQVPSSNSMIINGIYFIPSGTNICYEEATEQEYLVSNRDLLVSIINAYNQAGGDKKISQPIMDIVSRNELTFNSLSELVVKSEDPIKKAPIATRYLKDLPNMNVDLVNIINAFSDSSTPVSFLYMAIDLYFRSANVYGTIQLVRAAYDGQLEYDRVIIGDVFNIVKGRVYYNPVYNGAQDLSQLVTFHKTIIDENPALYTKVDVVSFYSQMMKRGGSKRIGTYSFFHETSDDKNAVDTGRRK